MRGLAGGELRNQFGIALFRSLHQHGERAVVGTVFGNLEGLAPRAIRVGVEVVAWLHALVDAGHIDAGTDGGRRGGGGCRGCTGGFGGRGLARGQAAGQRQEEEIAVEVHWMRSAVAEGSRDHAAPAGSCMCRKARFSDVFIRHSPWMRNPWTLHFGALAVSRRKGTASMEFRLRRNGEQKAQRRPQGRRCFPHTTTCRERLIRGYPRPWSRAGTASRSRRSSTR